MKIFNAIAELLRVVIFPQKGFSLVQTMVAVGIAGMVAVGTMRLMQQTTKVQKTAERSSTISQLYNQAYTALSSSAACDATLGSNVGSDFAEGAGGTVGAILQMVPDPANPTGPLITVPVLNSGNTYDGVLYSGASFERTAPAELTFTLSFEKEQEVVVGTSVKRTTYGGRVRNKSIRVAAFSGDTLVECNGVDTALGEEVKQEFCEESIGGVWVPGTPGECQSISINPDPGNPAIIANGPLDVTGPVEVDGPVCNGTNCINPEVSSCNGNELLTGFAATSGDATCLNIQTAVQNALAAIIPTCGSDETLTHTGGGNFDCVPVGTGTTTGVTTTTVPPPGGDSYTSYICQATGWSGPGGSCATETPDCSTTSPVSVGYNACCLSSPNPMKCLDTTSSGLSSYRCVGAGWAPNPGGDATCTDPDTMCVAGSPSIGDVICCPGMPNSTCGGGAGAGFTWSCNASKNKWSNTGASCSDTGQMAGCQNPSILSDNGNNNWTICCGQQPVQECGMPSSTGSSASGSTCTNTCSGGVSSCISLCPANRQCSVYSGNCPGGSGGVNCTSMCTTNHGNVRCYGTGANSSVDPLGSACF